MSIETRSALEPKDIVAIEYECTKCHARSVRRLEPEHPAAVPRACGNCQGLYLLDASREAAGLAACLNFLAHYKSEDFPFILRFEVAGLGDAAREARRRAQTC
jgi:hypothetical protein